jgi:transformer-2 protein
LHGRRLRVDYSLTQKGHSPTPGRYLGSRRREEDKAGRRRSRSRSPPRRRRYRSHSRSRSRGRRHGDRY